MGNETFKTTFKIHSKFQSFPISTLSELNTCTCVLTVRFTTVNPNFRNVHYKNVTHEKYAKR